MSPKGKGKDKGTKQSSYRLDFIDNQTLEKIGSIGISKTKFLLGCLLLAASIILITGALVIYTPLKQYIPGYADIEKNPKFISLHKNVLQLEKTVEAQNRYVQSLQRLVTGQDPNEQSIKSTKSEHQSAESNTSTLDYTILSDVQNELSEEVNVRKRIEELYLVSPLKGIISASFLEEKRHLGVDIVAPGNTPIKSILSGHVILSDWTLETGYSIGIQHDYGLVTFYKHNSALLKSTGDYITAGEAIAVIGNTGEMTSGPHLHFEIWRDGKPINPEDYINFD